MMIPPFERIELPDLAVIVGLNGAGKSQLLQGISTGAIASSVLPGPTQSPGPNGSVVLLTNGQIDPQGLLTSQQSDLNAIMREPPSGMTAKQALDEAVRISKEVKERILSIIQAETGTPLEAQGIAWTSLVLDYNPHILSASQSVLFAQLLTQHGTALTQGGIQVARALALYGRRDQFEHRVQAILQSSAMPRHFLGWSREQLKDRMHWPKSQLFEPELARIFQDYRDKDWLNQLQLFNDQARGTTLGLSPVEFVTKYGTQPWYRVTKALHAVDLPYSVAPIDPDPSTPVEFKLVRVGSNTPISFANLSTGEKILFRMVLATFHATDDRMNVQSPRLILLDELDASLHPQNTQRWLDAVHGGYVDTLGIPCILTTHSPVTVALAPEGAIFEMSADDPRPRPIAKQVAVDRLTAGLPMLSIDYSARRQVFVESEIDVGHYSRVHDIMRTELALKRTLSFVGTSTKGSCTFVYDMVSHMVENGNRSVYGIVDWDTRNKPADRVAVLADGTHYAKDNVLLDPLLIGALLLRNNELTLDPPIDFLELKDAPDELLQRLSDAVVEKIEFPAAASTEMGQNEYFGGKKLSVRRYYQERQGHELEKAIKKAFPMFDRYRGEGDLATAIIERVIRSLREYCPKPLTDIMTSIANDD
ncbi:MAG TPA: AAA family ATPase [Sphingomonas sp.]|nr:AAA family ATPase [Sphingomonas sp.]